MRILLAAVLSLSRLLIGFLWMICSYCQAQVKLPASHKINIDTIEMVMVKADTFTMGNKSGALDEKPEHVVSLKDYYIARYEVTVDQWIAVMGETAQLEGCDSFSCSDCPVKYVSWDQVNEFIKKLNLYNGTNYRLPTEAEWEFAARGGKLSHGFKYSGSNNPGDVAWFGGNRVHPVGRKKPNELGIYDMSGNVAEWCSDWYYENYYTQAVSDNPKGPVRPPNPDFRTRVIRGGSWGARPEYCTVTFRYDLETHDGFNGLGFRLAKDF